MIDWTIYLWLPSIIDSDYFNISLLLYWTLHNLRIWKLEGDYPVELSRKVHGLGYSLAKHCQET